MKTVAIIGLVLSVFASAACGSTPTAAPATATATLAPAAAASATSSERPTALPASTVAAGEVVKLAGDSFTTSDPFHIGSDTTLEITWNYKGSGPFALWLINVSEEVTDPRYDRMLITDVGGAPAGTARQAVIAGDYTLQVEQASGPWTVEIKPAP